MKVYYLFLFLLYILSVLIYLSLFIQTYLFPCVVTFEFSLRII